MCWQERFEAWFAEHHQSSDVSHDISHFRRVWATARRLAEGEAIDSLVLLTACYFHDIVSLEKTRAILREHVPDFPEPLLPAVAHAIEAHSHSAQIAPRTPEAKILQDADRLESLGAIGLARVFAVAGRLGFALFDPQDPFAGQRELDDTRYALDHFQRKLLGLPETMQTERGRRLARHNAAWLVEYMAKLSAELSGDYLNLDAQISARFAP